MITQKNFRVNRVEVAYDAKTHSFDFMFAACRKNIYCREKFYSNLH